MALVSSMSVCQLLLELCNVCSLFGLFFPPVGKYISSELVGMGHSAIAVVFTNEIDVFLNTNLTKRTKL